MKTLRDVLTQSEKDGVALGHFNVANFVMLKAVLGAAAESRSRSSSGRPKESENS